MGRQKGKGKAPPVGVDPVPDAPDAPGPPVAPPAASIPAPDPVSSAIPVGDTPPAPASDDAPPPMPASSIAPIIVNEELKLDNDAIQHAADVLRGRGITALPTPDDITLPPHDHPSPMAVTVVPVDGRVGFSANMDATTIFQCTPPQVAFCLHPGVVSSTDIGGKELSRDDAVVDIIIQDMLVLGFDNGLTDLFRPLQAWLSQLPKPMCPPTSGRSSSLLTTGHKTELAMLPGAATPLSDKFYRTISSDGQRVIGNTEGSVKISSMRNVDLLTGAVIVGGVDIHDTAPDRRIGRLQPACRTVTTRRDMLGFIRNVKARGVFFSLNTNYALTLRAAYDRTLPARARPMREITMLKKQVNIGEQFLHIEPIADIGTLGPESDTMRSIASANLSIRWEAAPRTVIDVQSLGMKMGVGTRLLNYLPFSSDNFERYAKAVYMGCNVVFSQPNHLGKRGCDNWTGYMSRMLSCLFSVQFQYLPTQQMAVLDQAAQNYPYERVDTWAAFAALRPNPTASIAAFQAAVAAYGARCLVFLVNYPLQPYELDGTPGGPVGRQIRSIPGLLPLFLRPRAPVAGGVGGPFLPGPRANGDNLAPLKAVMAVVTGLNFQNVLLRAWLAVEPQPRNAAGARALLANGMSFQAGALAVVLAHAGYARAMIADPFHIAQDVSNYVVPTLFDPSMLAIAIDGVKETRMPNAPPDAQYAGMDAFSLMVKAGMPSWWFAGEGNLGIPQNPEWSYDAALAFRLSHDFMQSVQNITLFVNALLTGACRPAPAVHTCALLVRIVSNIVDLYYGEGKDSFVCAHMAGSSYSILEPAVLGSLANSPYVHFVADAVYSGLAVPKGIAARPCSFRRLQLWMANNPSFTSCVSLATRGLYVCPPTDQPVYTAAPLPATRFSTAPMQYLVMPAAGRRPFPVTTLEVNRLVDSGLVTYTVPLLDFMWAAVSNTRGIRRTNAGLPLKRFCLDAFVVVSKIVPFAGHITTKDGNVTDIGKAVAPIVMADSKSTSFSVVSYGTEQVIEGNAASLRITPRTVVGQSVNDDYTGRVILAAGRRAIVEVTVPATIHQLGEPLYSRHSVLPLGPRPAIRMFPTQFGKCVRQDITGTMVLAAIDSEVFDICLFHNCERLIRLDTKPAY